MSILEKSKHNFYSWYLSNLMCQYDMNCNPNQLWF